MKPLRWRAAVTGLAFLSMASPFAHAQVERRGGEANGLLLQQIQELTSERTNLQGENARLKKQLDDLTKQHNQLKSAQKAIDQRVRDNAAALAQSSAQRDADEKDLKLYKQRMQELIDKFKETIETLRRTEVERATLKETLAGRDREVKACLDHNAALYQLNEEVLARWEKQSFWSRISRTDPFTRIAQTRLENMTDDFRSRADAQRTTAESLKAAAAVMPPPPPAPAANSQGQPPAAPGALPGSAGAPSSGR